MKTTARCPTCKRDSTKDGNKFFPFCCERCQLVDLGRWLDEDYRIPAEPVDGGTESEPDLAPGKDDEQ